MPEATIYTGTVAITMGRNAVEVDALLLEGSVEPGMYLHIPFNRWFGATLHIQKVDISSDGSLRLVLDYDTADEAEFVLSLNFENETLIVTDSG